MKIMSFAEFAEKCREHGLKATQQRFEIYSELVSSDKHPDAESVYTAIRKRMPSLSFDTVYRAMRMFEEKGVISRISPGLERTRYDANMERHHHFICGKCGKIIDLYSEDFNSIALPDSVGDIGKVEYVHIEVRGICNKCRKSKLTG
jgi:Fur family transcriptional regulator, peroxide stress response regulator